MSAAQRMSRRRAGASAGELDTERRENTATRRVARARMTSTDRAADRRADTAGRRAARARRTSTDRAIERSENTASRRATRAQQPSDVRAVLRRKNTERRRVARNRTMSGRRARRRAGASTCSRSVWNELPLHRTPNPTPITLGSVKVCSYCRARLLQHEESSFCRRDGKLAVEPLPALPSGWIEMFTDPMFRKNSRKYN